MKAYSVPCGVEHDHVKRNVVVTVRGASESPSLDREWSGILAPLRGSGFGRRRASAVALKACTAGAPSVSLLTVVVLCPSEGLLG